MKFRYFLLLFALAFIGCANMQTEQEQEQVWAILCEDSTGVYTITYNSVEPYDYIEEVHLCEN